MGYIISSICLILAGILLVVKPHYMFHIQHADSTAAKYKALVRLMGYSAVIAGMFLFFYLLAL